ncbi:MAG: hypothetical protein AAGC88_05480 [Bacteroidota bacterium]
MKQVITKTKWYRSWRRKRALKKVYDIPRIQEWVNAGWISYQELGQALSDNLLEHYVATGKAVPPPHRVKEQIILKAASEISAETLVETGTYKGEMLEALENDFSHLYSIEIDPGYYHQAIDKFDGRSKIKLFLGDSAHVLKEVVQDLPSKPIVFWLDGHYSPADPTKGDKICPIYEELAAICEGLESTPFTILIDDAKQFTGEHDYPTKQQLSEFLSSNFRLKSFEEQDDIFKVGVH